MAKGGNYVDGFVMVVPKDKVAAYKKIAKDAGKVWKKHGALDYMECIGDDLNPSMGEGKVLTFPKIAKLKENETVWFSFITYKSRKHRDSVNKKVMKDPAMNPGQNNMKDMPFDMKRMVVGGFKAEVNL